MNPAEQIVIANVARYHRAAEPRKSHRNFGPLSQTAKARVTRLAAILRVADGFDRGHSGSVDDIRVRWLSRALRLIAVPSPKAAGIRLELWGASRKSGLLAKVAGTDVEIVGPGGVALSAEGDGAGTD
jgi:exopolyphosphatase/guanosine-5'-triphosphate,3'-diphosphate pyrophosphatase